MKNLIPIEFKNQRILTTEQLSEVYNTEPRRISENFNRNFEHFILGKHYYLLQGENLREFKHQYAESVVAKNASQLYLWTERGANRHCKILDTDKAWEQFDNLEENYFQGKNELALPRSYADALRELAATVEAKEVLQIENAQQKQIINELQPKATYYDLVLQNPTLISISVIAKDYGMSGTKMNELLHENGVQYKMGTKKNYVWLLYAKHQDKGYTFTKTQPYVDSKGVSQSKAHTYWTQKGRLFIYDLLKQNEIFPLIERGDVYV